MHFTHVTIPKRNARSVVRRDFDGTGQTWKRKMRTFRQVKTKPESQGSLSKEEFGKIWKDENSGFGFSMFFK